MTKDPYYRRWYSETYHDQYREYRKLDKDDQKRYWDWRHDHEHEHEHEH